MVKVKEVKHSDEEVSSDSDKGSSGMDESMEEDDYEEDGILGYPVFDDMAEEREE